jgi:hypothetical protein
MRVARRLGSSPQERGSLGNATCPDIFELQDGRFAVIGTDVTGQINLPADAGCAPYERVVVITRETLTSARADIPEQ